MVSGSFLTQLLLNFNFHKFCLRKKSLFPPHDIVNDKKESCRRLKTLKSYFKTQLSNEMIILADLRGYSLELLSRKGSKRLKLQVLYSSMAQIVSITHLAETA